MVSEDCQLPIGETDLKIGDAATNLKVTTGKDVYINGAHEVTLINGHRRRVVTRTHFELDGRIISELTREGDFREGSIARSPTNRLSSSHRCVRVTTRLL